MNESILLYKKVKRSKTETKYDNNDKFEKIDFWDANNSRKFKHQ